jgi:hypothetical protein
MKTQKIYQFEAKKKIKNFKFFQKCFWNAKINRILPNSVKTICKKCFTKTVFQTQFFSESCGTKSSLVCYQTLYCVCFTVNTKKIKK